MGPEERLWASFPADPAAVFDQDPYFVRHGQWTVPDQWLATAISMAVADGLTGEYLLAGNSGDFYLEITAPQAIFGSRRLYWGQDGWVYGTLPLPSLEEGGDRVRPPEGHRGV